MKNWEDNDNLWTPGEEQLVQRSPGGNLSKDHIGWWVCVQHTLAGSASTSPDLLRQAVPRAVGGDRLF